MADRGERPLPTWVELRPIRSDDWGVARCVRLAALADAPEAFAGTLEEELNVPEALWRERAASNAQGLATAGFLALREGVPCGIVIGVRAASGTQVQLNALWVAGNVRRVGIARALVKAVCDWARERGADQVELTVTTASHAALALYRALGFEVQTGQQATCGVRRAPALRMWKSVVGGLLEVE